MSGYTIEYTTKTNAKIAESEKKIKIIKIIII